MALDFTQSENTHLPYRLFKCFSLFGKVDLAEIRQIQNLLFSDAGLFLFEYQYYFIKVGRCVDDFFKLVKLRKRIKSLPVFFADIYR